MDEKGFTEHLPGISFSLKWGRIRIYRSNLYYMNNPKYIRMLFDPNRRLFALQACGRIKGSIRVPENIREDWEFRLNSMGLLRMIWSIFDWDEDFTYQVRGKYYDEKKLVEYDLSKADIISG